MQADIQSNPDSDSLCTDVPPSLRKGDVCTQARLRLWTKCCELRCWFARFPCFLFPITCESVTEMAGTTETIPFNGCQNGVSHVSIPVSTTLFHLPNPHRETKGWRQKQNLRAVLCCKRLFRQKQILRAVLCYKGLYGMLTVFLKRGNKFYVFK